MSMTPTEKRELVDAHFAGCKRLSYREREIIKLRYGLGHDYPYTLEEVGYIFKVTRERIRQIEAKALRKLIDAQETMSYKERLAAAIDRAETALRDGQPDIDDVPDEVFVAASALLARVREAMCQEEEES